jgi:predicted methyltransferase
MMRAGRFSPCIPHGSSGDRRMKLYGLFVAAAALVAGVGVTATAQMTRMANPSFIAKAIADPNRPADERAQDANRKPVEVLQFSEIKPGDKVIDLMPGAGYYTRLFSKIVGAQGAVYAVQPTEMDKANPSRLKSLKSFAGTGDYQNVAILVQPIASLQLPKDVDLVFTSQNYHDLHDPFMGTPDMARINKTIFNALKPGGIYIVLDHAAAAGTGTSKTNDLHRIDPAVVKAEVTKAGFQFVGESDVLANPADDHTLAIFNPAIKGKTDKFIYKFRKP